MPKRLAVRVAQRAAARRSAERRSAQSASRRPSAETSLAARPAPQLALPAPPKPLALPAPGPGLPPEASKPRGGQFWTGKADAELSPDDVARKQAEEVAPSFYSNDELLAGLATDAAVPTPASAEAVQGWLAKALAKYYKTDFGSPDDPLRDLAARGLHYDPDMTPEKWKAVVDSFLLEDPIEQIMFPPNRLGGMPGAGSDLRGETLAAMPWLAKQPVTDNLYGISGGGLDIGHFADEFANALNPEMSGLPMDLAVRPESLGRMTFPQAVERVGHINQFRVKKMQEEAQAALNNPAIQTFKEYPDAGYRWVELRQPEGTVDPNSGYAALRDALQYEGDTMGHCVGGYCDAVASGRSRIYSLRDAKGQPHVTIEAAPVRRSGTDTGVGNEHVYREAVDAVEPGFWDAMPREWKVNPYVSINANRPDIIEAIGRKLEQAPPDIIQIKGKQNRAPTDDYLPYVQDFVKSGTWGNIGDFGNTGLVKLPDGRYISRQQLDEVINSPAAAAMLGSPEAAQQNLAAWNLKSFNDDEWRQVGPLFEGYALGGRVSKDRCFSRNPMSVR